jgi:ABC-type transport system substrate-binding protein
VELQKAGFEIVTEPGGTYALVPDSKTSASPWSNTNVRLAASYALDRESLAKGLGFGFVKPAYQLYPSFSQTAIPGLIKHSYDLSKAKDLLRQAGYPDGFKSVVHPFGVIPSDYTTAIATQLRDAGILMEIDKCTMGKYMDYLVNGWGGLMNHAFNSYANFASMRDYFDGITFPTLKLSTGFNEGLDAAAFAKDIDPKLIQATIQIMCDDVMVIPYVEESRIVFLQKGVHDPCTQTFPLMQYIDKEVWLEPSAR